MSAETDFDATAPAIAETKSQVSARHRQEWREFRIQFLAPCYEPGADAEDARLAKGVADILKVYQEGERKAWGFADGEGDNSIDVGWQGD